jgi:putative flippase GtrA
MPEPSEKELLRDATTLLGQLERDNSSESPGPLALARPNRSPLLRQFLRFGVVGAVALAVDVVVFNALVVVAQETSIPFVVVARIVSLGLGVVVNYIGNRVWTFKDRSGEVSPREIGEFAIVALGSGALSFLPLFIFEASGLRSLLEIDVAIFVIGGTLSTTYRFFLYRYWVFHERHGRSQYASLEESDVPEEIGSAHDR